MLGAFFAGKLLAPQVNCQMLIQICLLSEALVTTFLWAHKWSLFGMHSQMVKEIMPFSEEHRASRVVTLQNFDQTLSTRIFVLEDSKSPCLGYTLLNLNG